MTHWVALSLLFALLVLLLFAPSLRELRRPRDADPLDVNPDYTRDPAYFGERFRGLLDAAARSAGWPDAAALPVGIHTLTIGQRAEPLTVLDEPTLAVPAGTVLLRGPARIRRPWRSADELAVLGDLEVDAPLEVRALYVAGSLRTRAPVRVDRWVHVEGAMRIGAAADLGVSAFARVGMELAGPIRFYRLFAPDIVVPPTPVDGADPVILQPVAADGRGVDLSPTQPTRIAGAVVSDGAVCLRGPVHVLGHLWAQDRITLLDGVVVGEAGQIRSVLARGGVRFGPGVRVRGFVLTEEPGWVLEEPGSSSRS